MTSATIDTIYGGAHLLKADRVGCAHTDIRMWSGEREEITLHDNVADPYQLQNIAGAHPGLEAELGEEMNNWLEKTGDPWLTEK